nr:tigger transposable element-derived protein 2-like [Parasteatoda tepidariorum]
MPLMIIGKSRNPRAFKNIKTLPVIYAPQNKEWMNTKIFIERYDKTHSKFEETSKEFGKNRKSVTPLGQFSATPNPDFLYRENGKFHVVFLPPNVTPLIQPMDPSVIETVKCLYRKQLLRKILLLDEQNEGDF